MGTLDSLTLKTPSEVVMESQYLALDGSVISVESESHLRPGPVTTTGWAIVPSMMRAHPFTSYPAGHSRVMERSVKENFPDVNMHSEEEVSLNEGTLRVGQVDIPREGDQHTITVGAWEGRHSCMTTSLPAGKQEQLMAAFGSLQFSDRDRGMVIDSPMVTIPRPPELIQELGGLGVISIRPAISTEMDRIPRSEGHKTQRGELFRVRANSQAMVYLGSGSVVRIQPRVGADESEMVEALDGLHIAWSPRPSPRTPR